MVSVAAAGMTESISPALFLLREPLMTQPKPVPLPLPILAFREYEALSPSTPDYYTHQYGVSNDDARAYLRLREAFLSPRQGPGISKTTPPTPRFRPRRRF